MKKPVGFIHSAKGNNEDEAIEQIDKIINTLSQVEEHNKYKKGELNICLMEIKIIKNWELSYEDENKQENTKE